MKNKSILIVVLSYVFIYLMVSFYSLTFNPALWTEAARFSVCMFGGMISLAGVFLYNMLKGI